MLTWDVTNGYYIQVSRAGPGVARFFFKELCGLPLVKHLHFLSAQAWGLCRSMVPSCAVSLKLSAVWQFQG